MNARLDVRELIPAGTIKTHWLHNMIGDAGKACKFEKGLPGVDISPLLGHQGPFMGMIHSGVARWAVTLSVRCSFWRRVDIVRVYLHECAHLLVCSQLHQKSKWTPHHGPVFFLILLALYLRVDLAKKHNFKLVTQAGLYDFQDSPHEMSVSENEWRSIVIGFAIKHYQQLAESDFSAEDLTLRAFDLWAIQLQELKAQEATKAEEVAERALQMEMRKKLAREKDHLKDQVAELERQRSISFGWRFLFVTDWVGVITAAVLVGGIFTCAVFAVGYSLGLHRVFA